MLKDNCILLERIRLFSLLLALVLVTGTVGYAILEGWNAADGFYMSVITLATVGYGETRDLSQLGRLFTCGLIFFSIISLSCWTACLTSLFVDREFTSALKKRRAKKMAKKLEGHTIVCGSGTMAITIINTLLRKRQDVVVVDSDPVALKMIGDRYRKAITIQANAIDEFALSDANVLEAKCIIATLESDYDNLMIALTCKDLGTDIKIIARSNELQIASRMLKVGVSDVICPFQLSGEHAAKLACS